jgi:tetratricopeptide (TPR) repeat protein
MRLFGTALAFLIAALSSLGPTAEAAMNPSAAELYRAGEYAAAIDKGEAVGDAENLAIAAQAAVVVTTLKGGPCLECAKRAEALARQAIAADPARERNYVALVTAIGFQSRIMGAFASRNAHLPDDARRGIDKALMLARDDPWVLAAMGGWHIEVARMAGRVFAGLLYGARVDDGVEYFKRAVGKGPDDPVVAVNYALELSTVAFNSRKPEIRQALEVAIKATPHDAYEAAMKARAEKLNALIDKSPRDYLALANSYLGFPS